MCSKLKLLSAILLLSLTISTRQISALLADDIASAAAANTIQAKFDFLKNAWTDIRFVQPLDENSTAILHRAINSQLILNPQNLTLDIIQRRNIYSFYQEVRKKMIKAYGCKLAQVMSIDNKNHLNTVYLRSIVTAFEYDPGTALKMFEESISELYDIKKLSQLTQYLDSVSFTENRKSWDLKVDCQLFLYNSHLNRFDNNEEYLLLISYYFRVYKKYSPHRLSDERNQQLDNAISTLRPPLKTLFFGESVCCVKNKAFSENLFEKIVENAAKNDIFTRNNYNFTSGIGNWVLAVYTAQDGRGFLILRISLRNNPTNNYVFVDFADGNKIVGGNLRPWTGRLFNLNIKDNNLVFSNRGFLMCASNTANENWRTVYALPSTVSRASAACQWDVVDNCSVA